jgi:hypothetical protein
MGGRANEGILLPSGQTCVYTGRQYRISFGGNRMIAQTELEAPDQSFASRLTRCLMNKMVPTLDNLLLQLTKAKCQSLVVINFDETNMLLQHGDQGKQYLLAVLAAVQAFSNRRQGFVLCIMSGTNVRDLHDVLKVLAGGTAPLEIPLPLLCVTHMKEILVDLAGRCAASPSTTTTTTVGEDLEFPLKVLGGVPRYIEVMVFLLGKDDQRCFDSSTYISSLKNSPQPHLLLEGIRNAINAQYGETFTMMLLRATQDAWSALVSTSLFRWNVTRDDKFGDRTIAELGNGLSSNQSHPSADTGSVHSHHFIRTPPPPRHLLDVVSRTGAVVCPLPEGW